MARNNSNTQNKTRRPPNTFIVILASVLATVTAYRLSLFIKQKYFGNTSKKGVFLYNPASNSSGAFQNFDSAYRAATSNGWKVATIDQVFTASNNKFVTCVPGFASNGQVVTIGQTSCKSPINSTVTDAGYRIVNLATFGSAGIFCYGILPVETTSGVVTSGTYSY